MNLVDQVKNAGVVGAGGAGFPTHVKLQSQVEYLLVNGAECEPLMHKDRELMKNFAVEIIKGVELAADVVGASQVVIGIKSKNRSAIESIQQQIKGKNIRIKEFGDYYPAGDEYELVYTITGRLIPPQGLPLDVGCVVNNVETFYNIYRASEGIAVTETFVTITGAVETPLSTLVPIGMSVNDVLQLAGGANISEFAVMESGLMMGKPVKDLRQPVTKTTGGLIVLPKEHNLIQRYEKPPKIMDRIGHSACDQCSYCTELCPRYLLGYDVQPHLVMRSLGFSATGAELWNSFAQLCCQCGICTLYSCPENLYPREACIHSIKDLKAAGKGKWEGTPEIKVHPMKNDRRVPVKRLMNRLGITRYDAEAEYVAMDVAPEQVHISLKQHVGEAATSIVSIGQLVEKAQEIAVIKEGKLGANIHASITGRVREIGQNMIIIERVN
ncbi:MAG: NADH dehydrogenase subunit [Actinobacteria bacterium]|nr:NADH dehydrogenase subunit [Actinomycetota bacterium]